MNYHAIYLGQVKGHIVSYIHNWLIAAHGGHDSGWLSEV